MSFPSTSVQHEIIDKIFYIIVMLRRLKIKFENRPCKKQKSHLKINVKS
jgi:hypothetical protein